MDLVTLRERILDRSTCYPVLLQHGSLRVATDGVCALLTRDDARTDAECPQRVADVLAVTPKRPKTVRLSALKGWLGPAGIVTVEPCPKWERHERFAKATAEAAEYDDAECYYGCQFVEGLGYAYETSSRPFARETRDTEWGMVGGITVDCARLAELLAPWEDCDALFWRHAQALHLASVDDSWHVVLMSGNARRITVSRGSFNV